MSYRNIISMRDFSKEDLLYFLQLGKSIAKCDDPYLLQDKILSTLFFEPSTRTRMSFETAMLRLGGTVTGISSIETSSVLKGESLSDTIKMASLYSNIIVLRHPTEGAARYAADFSSVPVINAGDGANQHPTQTLLDMFTIMQEFGSFDGLRISFVSDLKYSRTVHSLLLALSKFNVSFIFCAPKELSLPRDLLSSISNAYVETEKIDEALNADVLYMTRIQKERFPDNFEYKKVSVSYTLNKEKLAGHAVKIMHPLPRIDEISKDVDTTQNAIYFKQAENGVIMRQAILARLLGRIS